MSGAQRNKRSTFWVYALGIVVYVSRETECLLQVLVRTDRFLGLIFALHCIIQCVVCDSLTLNTICSGQSIP